MAEYIERQAARPDVFCEGVSCQECPFLIDPIKGGCRVDNFIMALPPADVRPVVRGKWVLDRDPGEPWKYTWKYKCDQCGEATNNICMGEPRYNYCPMCGADMRDGDADGNKKD